jgi:hypothetical protein
MIVAQSNQVQNVMAEMASVAMCWKPAPFSRDFEQAIMIAVGDRSDGWVRLSCRL